MVFLFVNHQLILSVNFRLRLQVLHGITHVIIQRVYTVNNLDLFYSRFTNDMTTFIGLKSAFLVNYID